jgi:hypothetical protein
MIPPMQPLRIPPPETEERLPRFDTPNVLWFFGAIATATATNSLIAAVSSSARGVWIMLTGLAFACVYTVLCVLLRESRWWVPGGLFATIVVTLVPATGAGFEKLIGVLPQSTSDASVDPFNDFKGSIFALGLVTIVVGLAVYQLVQFEFVLSVVALATILTVQWFLPAVDDHPSGDSHATTLLITGGLMVLVGFLLDQRGRRRVAFWWHVLGLGAVALGLVYYVETGDSRAAWIAMLITGAGVLLLAAPLGRSTWAVYGVAGTYAPLVHFIAEGGGRWQIPLILVFVSLGIFFLGIVLHVYGAAWRAQLQQRYRL